MGTKHKTIELIEVPEVILAPCDREVRARRATEYRIVHKLVGDLLAAGFVPFLRREGEGRIVITSNDVEPMADLFACDEERLYVGRPGGPSGWVFLVYGNDGWDVIADYTTNLEEHLKAVNAFADELA